MTPLAFVRRAFRFLHENLLALILAAYLCAVVVPGPGVWMAGLSLGATQIFGQLIVFSLPALMLASFLFNAGLGVKMADVARLGDDVKPLLAGVVGNTLVPLAFVTMLSLAARLAPDPSQFSSILMGAAIVASMPIAGSSTAWSQNSNGNLALSLGLVLLTTLFSPLTTPLVLASAGDAATSFRNVENDSVRLFLFVWVVAPSMLGLFCRAWCVGGRYERLAPYVKLCNTIALMLIVYSNAAVYLPAITAQTDRAYLSLAFGAVALLGVAMFGAGFALSGCFGLAPAETASLVFGLGMSNNGSSLVFASTAFPDQPRIVLPILFYVLVQHVAAALADKIISRRI
jgi:BASS family bile acid:Na+ symporter